MKTISKDDLRNKVLKGKASPSVLPKKPIDKKPDDSLKKLADSVNNFASETAKNTRMVASLLEQVKKQKTPESKVEVNVPEQKQTLVWEHDIIRDNRSLLKTIRSTRIE